MQPLRLRDTKTLHAVTGELKLSSALKAGVLLYVSSTLATTRRLWSRFQPARMARRLLIIWLFWWPSIKVRSKKDFLDLLMFVDQRENGVSPIRV
jgi:hypothetical protein